MAASPLAQIGEELAKIKEFLALLQQEQEFLARGDTEALLPLIDAKTTLTNQLGEYAQTREAHLKVIGLPAGRPGMQAWLERSGTPIERKQWQELIDQATKIRALNETNGKLIALHMQHNQQAFNALMAAANRANTTYGPDGQQHTGLGGRILGKA